MTDDGEDEPTVTLGAQQAVEGAPLARVSARLMWGIENSAIVEREGETTIRTPDGPRELADLLDAVDQSYFATRHEFENAVGDVIGDGPISAESAGDESEADEAAEPAEPEAEPDDEETADDEAVEAAEEEQEGDEATDAETAQEDEDETTEGKDEEMSDDETADSDESEEATDETESADEEDA